MVPLGSGQFSPETWTSPLWNFSVMNISCLNQEKIENKTFFQVYPPCTDITFVKAVSGYYRNLALIFWSSDVGKKLLMLKLRRSSFHKFVTFSFHEIVSPLKSQSCIHGIIIVFECYFRTEIAKNIFIFPQLKLKIFNFFHIWIFLVSLKVFYLYCISSAIWLTISIYMLHVILPFKTHFQSSWIFYQL